MLVYAITQCFPIWSERLSNGISRIIAVYASTSESERLQRLCSGSRQTINIGESFQLEVCYFPPHSLLCRGYDISLSWKDGRTLSVLDLSSDDEALPSYGGQWKQSTPSFYGLRWRGIARNL